MVVDTVPVGTTPQEVAITPDGTRAYVTNHVFASVSVIDTSTNTVVDTVPVVSRPIGIAITPDGAAAYVANSGSNAVSVIDTTTHEVTNVVVGGGPRGVAITPF
jgi:YVTN family beta-propeller protein